MAEGTQPPLNMEVAVMPQRDRFGPSAADVAVYLSTAGVCDTSYDTVWFIDDGSYVQCDVTIEALWLSKTVDFYRLEFNDTATLVHEVTLPAGWYLTAMGPSGDFARVHMTSRLESTILAANVSCYRAQATCTACATTWTGVNGQLLLCPNDITRPALDLETAAIGKPWGNDPLACPYCTAPIDIHFTA